VRYRLFRVHCCIRVAGTGFFILRRDDLDTDARDGANQNVHLRGFCEQTGRVFAQEWLRRFPEAGEAPICQIRDAI
jgi:hypothetical protein